MFFPKAISLLLLASVATGRPLAKPEPQTITISYAEIVELENYVQSECNSIQTTATNGWNVFQSVNNNFQGSFYVRCSILNYSNISNRILLAVS